MRFSYQPLVDLLGGNATTQAELLHTTPRTVQRWKREGLSREMAEDLADRVRSHPYELWPDLADFDLEGADRADDEALARRRAGDRASWHRRWQRMTEEEREARREYVRNYRKAARRAVNASRRRYYEQNREKELARQREYDARKRAERRQEALRQDTPEAA